MIGFDKLLESESNFENIEKMEFVFQIMFSERIRHRYLVYTKDLAQDQDVLMLPVFMVSLI